VKGGTQIEVFKNRELRRIFGAEMDELTDRRLEKIT
jgi:hypothetical protein